MAEASDEKADRDRALTLEHANRAHERELDRLTRSQDATLGIAQSALKALLLLNGGGAIALLAFVGSLASAPSASGLDIADLVAPLRWFAFGAGASVAAAAFAYFTSSCQSRMIAKQVFQWEHPYVVDTRASRRWGRLAAGMEGCAVLLAVSALSLFGLGVFAMIAAVETL